MQAITLHVEMYLATSRNSEELDRSVLLLPADQLVTDWRVVERDLVNLQLLLA